jgi:hypothetical protein
VAVRSLSDIQDETINSDGTVAKGEFTANGTTLASPTDASVTGLADGRFVMTFTDTSQDPDGDIV